MSSCIKKSIAQTMFQKQQFQTTSIRPVFYIYRRKAINGQSSSFQLMDGVVPRLNGDDSFPISKNPISFLSRDLELAVHPVLKGIKKRAEKKVDKIQRRTTGIEMLSFTRIDGSKMKSSRRNEDECLSIQMVRVLSCSCSKASSV